MKPIKNIELKILTSFWFLVALVLLLLNDFVLKGLYGNWFTGKLSDFSGLFIFSLFWATLFPKHNKKIFWVIGLLFIFWKSMYSQPIIDLWNSTGILQIARVVDFTDLIALSILPIAFMFYSQKNNVISLNLNPIFPLVVAVFAFCATSRATYSPEFNETFKFNFSKQELVRKINVLSSDENFLNNIPISLNLVNSNEFRLDDFNIDTIWYYSTGADTIYDTMWVYKRDIVGNGSLTDEIDTIYRYIHTTKDSMYVDNNGIFFYHIPVYTNNNKQSYRYFQESKLKLEGNDKSSSLTLLQLRHVDDTGDPDEHNKTLLHDFEVNFIDEIKKTP